MFEKIDIDIFSILLLAIVLFNHLRNSSEGMFRQRFFRALIICNMGIMLSDMLIYLLLEKPGTFAHTSLYALQSVFFMLCALFCLIWALYCSLWPGSKLRPATLILLSTPIVLLAVFISLNATQGFLFRINADNSYQRGPYFHLISVCTYAYVIYALIQIFRDKSRLTNREFYTYLLIPLFPTALGIVQLVLHASTLMVWPATALAMVMMQIVRLTEKINLDHLSGLYNRKYLDEYIDDVLQMNRSGGVGKGGKKFAAIMLDIDDFKTINDTFGHVEGDHAIILAADILRKSIRKGDVAARYGGDEFLIVLDQCSDSTPTRVIRRIRENVQKFNRENKLPYAIEFSMGYKVYSNLHGLTSKQIFTSIDALMYQNKHSKLGIHA